MCYFSNSVIIYHKNTKEITTVVILIGGFALNSIKND